MILIPEEPNCELEKERERFMSWKVGRKAEAERQSAETENSRSHKQEKSWVGRSKGKSGVLESRNQVTYRREDELLGCVVTQTAKSREFLPLWATR